MTRKALSFTTTINGTQLKAEVSVEAEAAGEDHLAYARTLTEHLMNVSAEYQPEAASREESLNAYTVLANTFQVLDLARDSADALPSQVKDYLFHASSNLEILAIWDPRFTAAYYLTTFAEELAGHFETSRVPELVGDIESLMPERFAEPGFTSRCVVVDDMQTPEDFAATRIPDHEALRVQTVDSDEMPEDFRQMGRTVLPLPMFPDGSVPNRVVVRAFVEDMFVVCAFETDREAFHLLRTLADAARMATIQRRGYTPVDFYTQLAYAKQLSWYARTERFIEDSSYRAKLIEHLKPCLSVLSEFGLEYETPRRLAVLADELNEDLGSDESRDAAITAVLAINTWLPRDLNEFVPDGWHDGLDAALPEPLSAGFNVLPGTRFVGVYDKQTPEEFEPTGFPDPAKFFPVPLGTEFDPELLGTPRLQLFRTEI